MFAKLTARTAHTHPTWYETAETRVGLVEGFVTIAVIVHFAGSLLGATGLF